MNRRIVITGATGLIGRYAVRVLGGEDLHLVSRHHGVNLLDPRDLDGLFVSSEPTHLLHLAWTTEHGKFWSDSANHAWHTATLHLVRRFIERGGKRVVVAGTCAEYDWAAPGPFDEMATPRRPRTVYGAAKDSTRRDLHDLCREAGVSFAWGRVFFLYGAGENPARFIPSVALPLLKGLPGKCNAPTLQRDFMHAADVAGAFVALLDSSVTGAVNIASGECSTLGEVAQLIARLAGQEGRINLGSAGPSTDHPLNLSANTNRLRNEVRFTPRFMLEDGLREYIEALRLPFAHPR